MASKRLVLYVVLLLSTCTIGVSATDDPGEFGASEVMIGSAGELFGYAVAVSGDYALVGRPDDSTQGVHAGAVHVYERRVGHWVQVARLLPSAQGQSRFGSAVALDGNVALIGADGAMQNTGTAYIFERREGVWTQVRQLVPGANLTSTYFGQAVAIAGNYVLVGAPREGNLATRTPTGAVYVFQRQQGVWRAQETQKLHASDAQASYGFGARLALAGSYALVGAPEHDRGGSSTNNYGAAYVFELAQGSWHEVAKLQASDGTQGDYFSSAVALADQQALIGAYGHDGKGAAYLFARQASTWTEVQKLTASDGTRGDRFGAALALTGDVMVIGAYGHDPQRPHDHDDPEHGADDADLETRPGTAYIFERQGSGWLEVEQLPVSLTPSHTHFGYAIALSEQHAIVGAPALFGGSSGRVYTYSNPRVNTVPQITSMPGITATVGMLYTYDVDATDADGDPLVYVLTNAPLGMVINATSGLITWRPTAPGNVTVWVEVHDNHGAIVTQRYTISVSALNRPPVITSTPVTTAMIGVPYIYHVKATDPDGDLVHYRLLIAPPRMVIDQTGHITWAPATPGNVSVQVQVDDARKGSVTQSYSITVGVSNQPPHITSTPVTSTEVFHVIPQVSISEAHLARQTITLNGQPYTPGTPISVDGDYILRVEATDTAGNASVRTVHFTIKRPAGP